MIPSITDTEGKPVMYVPLFVIVIITACKDLAEDYQRHKSDNDENNREIEVLQEGKFTKIKWKDIKVGNIIKISENEFLPADGILL